MTVARRRKAAVTQRDVAADAGVNEKDVSLAVRGLPGVSAEKRKRILEAAERLGLGKKKTVIGQHGMAHRMIGIVLPYIEHPTYAELISCLRSYAFQFGFSTMMAESMNNPETEHRLTDEFVRLEAAGIVFISPRLSSEEIDEISTKRLPVVTAFHAVGEQCPYSFGSVEINNYTGAREAVAYLIKQGNQRIAYLSSHYSSMSERGRRKGYRDALREAKIEYQAQIVSASHSHAWPDFQAGYDQCRQLLARGSEAPTAIFAYNDMIAIGAMKALRERGYEVPDNVSVIGSDGVLLGEFSNPPLSTMKVQWSEVAATIVDLLRGISGETYIEKRHYVIESYPSNFENGTVRNLDK